jgi:hypothetical protein
MTRRDGVFPTAVNETISCAPRRAKPSSSAARAASGAIPRPHAPGPGASDLDGRRERGDEVGRPQPDVADEPEVVGVDRPQAVAALGEAALDPVDEGVALGAGEGGRVVAHHLRVGVEGGEAVAVPVGPAAAEHQALGAQLGGRRRQGLPGAGVPHPDAAELAGAGDDPVDQRHRSGTTRSWAPRAARADRQSSTTSTPRTAAGSVLTQ